MTGAWGVEPFEIHVDDAVLDDLRARLRNTRWPAAVDDPGWAYGIEQAYLRDLARYWLEQYDWRKHEARLDAWPQYLTRLPDPCTAPPEVRAAVSMRHGAPERGVVCPSPRGPRGCSPPGLLARRSQRTASAPGIGCRGVRGPEDRAGGMAPWRTRTTTD